MIATTPATIGTIIGAKACQTATIALIMLLKTLTNPCQIGVAPATIDVQIPVKNVTNPCQ